MGTELLPFEGFNELARNGSRPLSATEAFHLGKGKYIEDFIMTRVFEALAKNGIALPPRIVITKNHIQVVKRGDTDQEFPNDMTFYVTLHPKEGGIFSEVATNDSNYETQAKRHWTLMRGHDSLFFECSSSEYPDFDDIVGTFSATLSSTAFEYTWTYFHPNGETSSHRFYNTENVQSGTPSEFTEHTSSLHTSNKSPNQHWTTISNADGSRDLSFFTPADGAHLQKSSHMLHEVVAFDSVNKIQTYAYEHTYHGPRIPKDAIHLAHHSVTLDSYGRITHITATWEKDGLSKPSHTTWTINYSPTAELER